MMMVHSLVMEMDPMTVTLLDMMMVFLLVVLMDLWETLLDCQ